MNIILYDSRASLPNDLQQHILVFTGFIKIEGEDQPVIVTEIDCTYRISGKIIEYKKNANARTQRFEEALGWAVHQAEIIGVTEIHAVFELSRPIDPQFLARICPQGIIDLRRRINQASDNGNPCFPAWPDGNFRKQPFSISPLRRYYVFRNKLGKGNKQAKASDRRRAAPSPVRAASQCLPVW